MGAMVLMVLAVAFSTDVHLERVAQERMVARVAYELTVLESGIVPWEPMPLLEHPVIIEEGE